MSDLSALPSTPAVEDRRAELRVPASTLGDFRSRLVGGSDFALLNYTSHGLYGQSHARLLVGARISVRLATATLNAVVNGRIVRAALTAVHGGVPSYEVAVSLEQPFDWAGAVQAAAASDADADAHAEAQAQARVQAEAGIDADIDADAGAEVPVPVIATSRIE